MSYTKNELAVRAAKAENAQYELSLALRRIMGRMVVGVTMEGPQYQGFSRSNRAGYTVDDDVLFAQKVLDEFSND